MSNIYWRIMEGLALVAKPIAAAFAVLAFIAVMFFAGVAVAVTMFGNVKLP